MNATAPRVTVVIVTYESIEIVSAALERLRAAQIPVVVVDNASSDGTADLVEQRHPWVTLVRSALNLGFGRGCNLGFTRVATPYVLLLNPDASMSPASIEQLVDWMEEHPKAAISAPAILENDRSHQAAGLLLTPATLLRSSLGLSLPYPDRRVIEPGAAPFRTTWVCGAAMMIRSSLFRSLGGFDERFFLYFEETDLCLRATHEGHEIWAVGECSAEHIGGASAKKSGEALHASCISEHYYRSRFYYLVKHFGWTRAVAAEVAAGAAQILRYCRIKWFRRGVGRTSRRVRRPFLRFPHPPRELT